MRRITRRRFLKLSAAFGLVASYPVFIERYVVLTNTYRIPVPNLPESFSGLRLVQLTDLHYGFLVPKILIQHVVACANRINCRVHLSRNRVGDSPHPVQLLPGDCDSRVVSWLMMEVMS